jgi:thiol-disulfide isomerase/thioredoxin
MGDRAGGCGGKGRGRAARAAAALAGLVVAATALAGCAGAGSRSGSVMADGKGPRPVPELRFVDGSGRQRSLADFRGRAILLNVWAPWCEPCRDELDSLDGLQARLGGPDFEVVALSLDPNGPGGVGRYYARHGVRALGVYVDPNVAAARVLGARGIPTTLLIDKEGREVGRTVGAASWGGRYVIEDIQRRLGRETTPAPGTDAGPAQRG